MPHNAFIHGCFFYITWQKFRKWLFIKMRVVVVGLCVSACMGMCMCVLKVPRPRVEI